MTEFVEVKTQKGLVEATAREFFYTLPDSGGSLSQWDWDGNLLNSILSWDANFDDYGGCVGGDGNVYMLGPYDNTAFAVKLSHNLSVLDYGWGDPPEWSPSYPIDILWNQHRRMFYLWTNDSTIFPGVSGYEKPLLEIDADGSLQRQLEFSGATSGRMALSNDGATIYFFNTYSVDSYTGYDVVAYNIEDQTRTGFCNVPTDAIKSAITVGPDDRVYVSWRQDAYGITYPTSLPEEFWDAVWVFEPGASDYSGYGPLVDWYGLTATDTSHGWNDGISMNFPMLGGSGGTGTGMIFDKEEQNLVGFCELGIGNEGLWIINPTTRFGLGNESEPWIEFCDGSPRSDTICWGRGGWIFKGEIGRGQATALAEKLTVTSQKSKERIRL